MHKISILGVAGVALTACGAIDDTPTKVNTDTLASDRYIETTSPDEWGEWGIDLSVRNQAVHPGDDFFMHVNGLWYDAFELPADKTSYGAFNLLAEKSEQQTRFIIEDLAAEKPELDTPAGKVAGMYNAFLDTQAIDAAGLRPAQPYLETISAIKTRADLATVFGVSGYSSPINGYVWVDAKDPATYIAQFGVSGLGLPDREYYLKTDETSQSIRTEYVALLTFLLERANSETPAEMAEKILDLETELARTHWDRATARNQELTYNKLSKEVLFDAAGDFPVAAMLSAIGLEDESHFIAAQMPPTEAELASAGLSPEEAAEKLGGGIPAAFALANTYDLEVWKAYLTAHFLADNASVLPSDIDQAVFDFYGTKLRGQPEQRPRWKRAVSTIQNNLGEAVGAVYVARHFPAENKTEMDKLVANLRTAMRANLADLSWMSEETRLRAEEKLTKFNTKIGYPDSFETYDAMIIGNSALENAQAARLWGLKDNIARLGTEPDRKEWLMTPQTVNAYYLPSYNEIVFPAAILQPPFFNMTADPAVNYGAIGGVIGHEIGHGFDDQGSKYSGDGVLENWWTKDDRAAFDALGDALVAQYNGFCPLEAGEPCINGRLSLGENIGDLGGLSLAYRAYQLSLDTDGDGVVSEFEQAPVLDGVTGDQRFFMAWAQVWRAKYRDEALRQRLLTGPHSPPYYRANGVVRNFDEWYAAFNVTQDHAMYLPPEERVRIW